MTIIMKNAPLITSIEQAKTFLKTNEELGVKYEIKSTRDKYEFIKNVLRFIKYFKLDTKDDRHHVLRYIKYFTGYSKRHLKRLVKKVRSGKLFYNSLRKRNKFCQKYFPTDIALLIKTDIAHHCLSGEATKAILVREYKVFKKIEYATISQISISHIYNFRNDNQQYNSSAAKNYKSTQATQVNIGVRRKPEPNGKPGYLRVDTVHQGDYLGNKGVYHVNLVDEVTQYEMIATVPRITEVYLKPIVEELLKLFPFIIFEFHADNGSEYINRYTVELLNKLHIELTKSRSRHSNDNALVESKNGSIIRKFFGRNYIAVKWATKIHKFNKRYLNPYLNYHRPCAFPKIKVDKKGKERKTYPKENYMIPYEKLKSLENAEQYLKPNFSFAELDKIAYAKSDNDFAEEMEIEKRKLFKLIRQSRN